MDSNSRTTHLRVSDFAATPGTSYRIGALTPGFRVEMDGELAAALAAAFADDAVYSVIDVRLGRFDVSAGLRRLAAQLR